MVDIYPTVKRIRSHKKKRNTEKIKVNFHYIIAEDKKRER